MLCLLLDILFRVRHYFPLHMESAGPKPVFSPLYRQWSPHRWGLRRKLVEEACAHFATEIDDAVRRHPKKSPDLRNSIK